MAATSSHLGSVDTVQADWNLMSLLTSASPAVTVALFIITAAEEEGESVVSHPPKPRLPPPLDSPARCSNVQWHRSLDAAPDGPADHAAYLVSDRH